MLDARISNTVAFVTWLVSAYWAAFWFDKRRRRVRDSWRGVDGAVVPDEERGRAHGRLIGEAFVLSAILLLWFFLLDYLF